MFGWLGSMGIKENRMKCYYHKSDLDGHCSGAIVKFKYPECEMIGVDYPDEPDFSKIKELETIFVVDFCFSYEAMWRIKKDCALTWIDHHKTSIEKMKGLNNIRGIREIGKAACELVWDFFYAGKITPLSVYYLGRYDVWDKSNSSAEVFQYGMRFEENTLPGAGIWDELLVDDHNSDAIISTILTTGIIILRYQTQQNAKYAKAKAWETTFEGLRCICINIAMSNSLVFNSVYDPEKHDAMVTYSHKPEGFNYSIYSTKPEVDVSQIALKYGGGGHKGAAGFTSKINVLIGENI